MKLPPELGHSDTKLHDRSLRERGKGRACHLELARTGSETWRVVVVVVVYALLWLVTCPVNFGSFKPGFLDCRAGS